MGQGRMTASEQSCQQRGAGRGVSWRLGERPGTRVRVRRCQGAGQVALGDFLGPFGRGRVVDEVHRRPTAGGGRNRASREREMEMGALLRFLKFQGPRGKLKFSPTWRAQLEKC